MYEEGLVSPQRHWALGLLLAFARSLARGGRFVTHVDDVGFGSVRFRGHGVCVGECECEYRVGLGDGTRGGAQEKERADGDEPRCMRAWVISLYVLVR
jgi:hypothetical protein